MAGTIADIGKNAVEDGVEDFFQAYIFRRMESLSAPYKKEFESGSEFDEAMQSFISTLSMGASLYAYNKIMNFFFERGVKLFTVYWTYIVAGSFKRKIIEKLKNKNLKGQKLLRAVSTILGSDRTSDRIEVAKMMQDNVKSFDKHKFHFQNQQQSISNNLDTFTQTGATLKSNIDNSGLALFNLKSKNGTWENTTADKKLYTKITGKTLAESGSSSWSSLYSELNKFTEFYKNADNEIVNLTTAIGKISARAGAVK